jgi:predicted Na+-dependent transporter
MQFFERLNRLYTRIIPFVTPSSLVLGLLLSDYISSWTFVVPWIFAFITFSNSLSCRLGDMKRVAMNPIPVLTALVFLHILMPLMGYLLGNLFFGSDPYLVTGVVIELAIPTAVMTIIWTGVYGGNTPLTLGILVVDTLATPFLFPLALHLFVGTTVEIDSIGIMIDLVFMVGIPAVLAMLYNEYFYRRGKEEKKLRTVVEPVSRFGFIVVVAVNASKIKPFVLSFDSIVAGIVLFMIGTTIAAYFLAFAVSRLLRLNRADSVSFVYNCSMRNISLGATIALPIFPGETMLPIMAGVLFQQIIAAVVGKPMNKLLRSIRDRK